MRLTPKTLSAAAQSFEVELSALRPLGGMEGLACEYRTGDSLNVLKIIRAESDDLQQIQKISEKLTFINWCQFDDVKEKWIQLGEQMEQLPQTRESFGLIHNDLHP